MNKALVMAVSLLAFVTIARASPPPPLPWVTSRFSVPMESGVIEFTMECPGGQLTRLSATRAQQVAHLPMERLAELSPSKTCSGVSTRASPNEEGSKDVVLIELTVQLSHEYVREELWISFDLQSFRFKEVMRVFTIPEEKSEVKRIKL